MRIGPVTWPGPTPGRAANFLASAAALARSAAVRPEGALVDDDGGEDVGRLELRLHVEDLGRLRVRGQPGARVVLLRTHELCLTAGGRQRARPPRSPRQATWSSSRPESLRSFVLCSSIPPGSAAAAYHVETPTQSLDPTLLQAWLRDAKRRRSRPVQPGHRAPLPHSVRPSVCRNVVSQDRSPVHCRRV